MKKSKFTCKSIGCKPMLIHVEINNEGSKITLQGKIDELSIALALACKMNPG